MIRHQAGYFLGPHTDLSTKLLVLLFYLPPDDSRPHLGTSLYRPKKSGFICPDSNHYPFDEFVNVKTALPAELGARLRTFGPVVPWCRSGRGGGPHDMQP